MFHGPISSDNPEKNNNDVSLTDVQLMSKNKRPVPGSSFGDTPIQPRPLDMGMGIAVARRTVFRKEDEECFGKVADRVAIGNMSLLGHPLNKEEELEKIRLRNAIASGALLTSGRHLQHGDENQVGRSIELHSNCASSIASFTKFFLLLNGAGVGRSYDDYLLVVDWHKAPNLLLYVSPEHPDYPHSIEAQCRLGVSLGLLPYNTKEDPTGIMRKYIKENFLSDLSEAPKDSVYHLVHDSREGWAKTLEILESMTFRQEKDKTLILDFSTVRREGTPIAGMQNRPASGPISVMRAFLNTRNNVINSLVPMPLWEQSLRIDHYFSVEVQVGGARRSARMATKDWKDPDIFSFIEIKSKGGLWTANHSIMVDNEFWSLVQSEKTNDKLSILAHDIFEKVTENMYINGEPGFINGDQLEDHKTGFARQKPVYEDGSDFESYKYQTSEASELLSVLSKKAKDTRFPVTVNPCVTGDTWVLTNKGPRQVNELIDTPFIMIVDGSQHESTGFWKTGTKSVFKLETDRGYEVRSTANHKFLVVIDRNQYRTIAEWKELSDIKINDSIVLSNHRKRIINTERNEEFSRGWLIGQMVGNGGGGEHCNYEAYVRFWGDQKEEMAEMAFSAIQSLREEYNYHKLQRLPKVNPDNDTISLSSKGLSNLISNLIGENKFIYPEFEKQSENLIRGFLCGLFDSDGTVAFNNEKGSSVRLSQSDLPRLKTVQRMLSRFGIISTIYTERDLEEDRLLPNGQGGYSLYHCKATNELVISRDNIDRYAEIIGFTHKEKSIKLNNILSNRSKTVYRDTFIAKVTSISPDGCEDVYDCTVKDFHRFDANGIVAHNCSEVTLHVTGAVCVISDFAPLLACPVPIETISPGEISKDIADLWDKRVEDSIRLGVRFLNRVNTMDALYGKEILRTNRIGIGPTGLHEYAWMRYGLDFNDLIDPVTSSFFWNKIKHFSDIAKEEANEYALEIGLNTPTTITTIKPAGSTSKLFGLTEGAHLPARRQYLRWVQFRGQQDETTGNWDMGSDKLLARYKELGYPIRKLNTFEGMTIVGFPTVPLLMRLNIGYRSITASEASPEEQYQWLRLLEKHWIGEKQGNQISYTLKVFTDRYDLDAFRTIIRKNQSTVRCCAVLPSKPDHELGYEYLPEEELSLEEFVSIVSGIKDEMIHEEIDLVHLQCASGACPI